MISTSSSSRGERRANHLGGAPVPSVAHSHSPTVPRTPAASLATVDLWAELEHCRSGEDDCITIERCRERRRNLDGDFSAADTTPVRQAARTPMPLGSEGGCIMLAPHLHMVIWPRKFWPHLPEKYDGSVNPTEFLQIYSISILAAGEKEVVMTNYFPVALTGTAQSWLMNLPQGSLSSWEEL
jgi:hypothetical protein